MTDDFRQGWRWRLAAWLYNWREERRDKKRRKGL